MRSNIADPIPPQPAAQTILDKVAVGIVHTRGGRILYCNRRAAEMLGFSAEEPIGRDETLLHSRPEDLDALQGRMASSLDAGQEFTGECDFRRKDGSTLRCRFSAHAIDPLDRERGIVWTLDGFGEHRLAETDLRIAQRELELIFESAVLGITLVRNRIIQRCNRRLEELFGYAPGEMTGQSTRIWYAKDEDYLGVGAQAYTNLALENYHRREQLFRRKDGSTFHGRIAGRALDPAQPQNGSVWLVEDVSKQRRVALQLELAQRVFDNSSEAIVITDANNDIISVNAAFEAITGYRAAEVIGRNPRMFKSGRHDRPFYEAMWHELLSTGHWRGELWDRSKEGRIYPKFAYIDVVRDPATLGIVNYLAVFSDISEQKAVEAQMRHQAQHDTLTGLANRNFLLNHIEHALTLSRRQQNQVALLFIDLDGFKAVNDTHGHAIGDRLLVAIAERLRQNTRESDVVTRLGGDEFVIVVEGRNTKESLGKMAEALIGKLSEPCPIDGLSLTVGCSIGIACAGESATPNNLLASADAAMYAAKMAGRGRSAFSRDNIPNAHNAHNAR